MFSNDGDALLAALPFSDYGATSISVFPLFILFKLWFSTCSNDLGPSVRSINFGFIKSNSSPFFFFHFHNFSYCFMHKIRLIFFLPRQDNLNACIAFLVGSIGFLVTKMDHNFI